MKPEVEAALVLVLAKRFGAIEWDGSREGVSPLGMARLVCAMSSDCRGKEDCITCVLGGAGCCLFDHSDEPGGGTGDAYLPRLAA
jgi:hypothetical protein